MGSSSWEGEVSTPGGGAPARRRARMSASVWGEWEGRVEGSLSGGSGKGEGAGWGGAVSLGVCCA